jgi:trimeric autotransporter adhesin
MRPSRATSNFVIVAGLLFTAAAQASTVSSAAPSPVDAGGSAFTLTVTGSGFAPGATVKWSGTALATTFQSDTQLTATVAQSLLSLSGKYPVTVVNSDSTLATGSVFASVNPVLSGISPNALPAGSNSVNVTAIGLGFSSNCVIGLIASGTRTTLNTSYGGPTALSAFVPASALTGIFPVSIYVTDTASGGVSQALPIALVTAQLTQISPTAVNAGTAPFTLFVGGANFGFNAKILFNGTPLVTTYLNSQTLSGVVTADLLPNPPIGQPPAQAGITVQNAGAPGVTASITLLVYPSQFGSTIAPPLIPTFALVGGPAFTLTVNGSGFVQGSTVIWQTTPLVTTFVNATQLTAAVPAKLINLEGAGVATITVATPGTLPSNPASFLINLPIPSIDSISPSTVIAGGPAFTLTINGGGFLPKSTVNGLANITTTYVSNTQLSVAVPASDIATVGSLPIQVANPGPLYSPQATTLIVQAPSPAPVLTTISPASVSPGGPDFTLTITGTGFSASSSVLWNTTSLATTFVSATQLTAIVPAALTAVAGAARITVPSANGTSNALAFTIASLLPTTSTAGIGNAASGQTAIAPGALFSIFGTLLSGSTASAAATPLLTILGGTTVNVNGKPIPLVFVSPGQINAQLPFEIQPGPATLVIQSGTLSSAAVKFTVTATGPGVFTQGVANPTHAVALNLQDGTLNTAQTPAIPGQYVTAYLTGQGAVNVALASGAAAPSTPPFALPVAPVQVTIGGQPATVQFAGLAPTFVGLLQMNLLIPNVAAGEQTLLVTIGGVTSAPVTLSIGTP